MPPNDAAFWGAEGFDNWLKKPIKVRDSKSYFSAEQSFINQYQRNIEICHCS